MLTALIGGILAVSASAPVDLAPSMSRIIGGDATTDCQFPSALLLYMKKEDGLDLCTGSLVHPNIILYAAHCGHPTSYARGNTWLTYNADGTSSVTGDVSRDNPIEPGTCKTYPGWQSFNGTDFAYCKLKEPITDLPTTPIISGCEHLALVADREATVVGYGRDRVGNTDNKNQIQTTIQAIEQNLIYLGPGGTICHGDSGGPTYMQLKKGSSSLPQADDSWRQIGISSFVVEPCQGIAAVTLASAAVPWVEVDSGIDITPCTDADGTWNPTAACKDFPLDLTAVEGKPSTGCRYLKTVASPTSACGSSKSAALQLVSPGPQSTASATPQAVEVWSTKPGAQVEAQLDGQPLAAIADYRPPHLGLGPVTWSPGRHTLKLNAKVDSKVVADLTYTVTVAQSVAEGGSAGTNTTVQPRAISCQSAGGAFVPAMAAGMVVMALRRRRWWWLERSALMLGLGTLAPSGCQMFTKAVEQRVPSAEEASSLSLSVELLSEAAEAGSGQDLPSLGTPPSLPASTATLTGTIKGKSVPVEAIVMDYWGFFDQKSTMLTFSSEAQRCQQHQSGQILKQDARELRIQLLSKKGNSTNHHNEGTYPVVGTNDIRTTPYDKFAIAAFVDLTATPAGMPSECVDRDSVLGDASWEGATAGSVSIHTVVTTSGALITGTLDLTIGPDGDKVAGSYIARSCSVMRLEGNIANCL